VKFLSSSEILPMTSGNIVLLELKITPEDAELSN
jgi:hypothetical protein